MTALANLRALVAKWRESARGGSQYSTTPYEDGCIAEQRRCADELDAAIATLSPAELGGVDYRKIAHQIYCHVGQCCGDPMCFFSADECTQARWVEAVETVITHHLSTPRADEAVTEEMVYRAARSLNDRNADECNVDREDSWKIYGDSYREDARAALTAAISPPSPGAAK